MSPRYRPIPSFLAILALISCIGATSAQSTKAPDVGEFERALEHRLQQLKPDGMTQRDVRFVTVLAGKPSGGRTFPFRATLVIRDYGPGFPKNRYYGQTCVGHINEANYTIEADAYGGWDPQGQMTPDLSQKQCKDNPSDGASSMPVESLPGTPAPTAGAAAATPSEDRSGKLTPTPPAASGAAMPAGVYECWANGEARGLMNFTVSGAGAYSGTDGKPGRFTVDAAGHVTFTGGAMDGAMPDGYAAVYHLAQGRPTLSIMSPRGAEAVFCQRK